MLGRATRKCKLLQVEEIEKVYMKIKKSIKISFVSFSIVAVLLMTQIRTFALEVPASSQTSKTGSSISSLDENGSLENGQVEEEKIASSSEGESETVSSSQEIESNSNSDVDTELQEIAPFVVAVGLGTQEEPYLVDITDTVTTPSAGYSVSLISAGKYVFTLTEAGAYYTVTGGSESAPSINAIEVAADNITVNLSDVHVRVNDVARGALSTQNYNVTLNLLEGTTNSFENSSSTSSTDAFAAGILHTPDKGNAEVSGELIIQGKGSLSVTGGYRSAGIGGGKNASGVVIIAEDATVTAVGGSYAAGIGGGFYGSNGTVQIIDNATVTSTSGIFGAGIGGGFGGSGGIIEISTSGNVTSSSVTRGAGIGGGYRGSAGDISISSSGVIKATGGTGFNITYSGGAGIGTGGNERSTALTIPVGNIKITSGTVFATGGARAPGIGYAEWVNPSGTATGVISGGNVYVIGEYPTGQIQMLNGQADNAEVFQNLLTVQDLTTSKEIASITVEGAEWYQINNSETFTLSSDPNKEFISVWLPETSTDKNIFAQLDGVKYRAKYTRGNTDPSETTKETLYKKLDVAVNSAIGGIGYISKINDTVFSASGSEPIIYPNDVVEITANPSPGYDFLSWDVQGVSISDVDKSANSFSFVASASGAIFTPSFKLKDYSITYTTYGGTNDSSNPNFYTYTVGVSSFEDPSKVGYSFENWYDDADFSNEISDISSTQLGDITLFAKWKANSYDIGYELNGGTNNELNPTNYTYNTGVENFENPSKRGYTFINWYDDANFSNIVTNISNSSLGKVTLYAKWEVNHYTISYNLDNGTNDSRNPSEYTYGIGVGSFQEPSKLGYTFEGWYTEPNFANKVMSISDTDIENVTLYAKWEANRYNITYNLNGGKDNSNSESYIYGIGIANLTSPEREGYTFDNWYSDANFTNVVTDISTTSFGDKTLYAKWSPKLYTLTYVTYDLKEIKTISLYMDDEIPSIEAPTVAGHHFAAWVIEGSDIKWDSSSKMPAKDISLVATYDKNTSESGISNSVVSPKTGDTTNIVLPIILLVAAVCILVIVFFVVRKNKK